MNYELSLKLKEAGFQSDFYVPVLSKDINGNPVELSEFVVDRFPTLEELIEACGEDFKRLDNLPDSNLFVAYSADSINKEGHGITPSEAVSNLWLELKKPKALEIDGGTKWK